MVNDGGIKRGDSAETGDEEARPQDGVGPGGSGVRGGEKGEAGAPTFDPSSLEEVSGDSHWGTEDVEDLTVKPMTDASLGLTNVPGHPPEDWAADTGPTRTPR